MKILYILAMLCWLPVAIVNAAPVKEVSVTIEERGHTSEALKERMRTGMQIVAWQLLQDKDSEALKTVADDYERLLGEIGDRVLTGYQIEKVSIQPAEHTQIILLVAPWNEVVNDVFVDLQFSGVEQETAAILADRLPALKADLESMLKGSSVDAVDWAGGILRRTVRERVEAALPEFKAAVDLVREDKRTVVQVVVYPVGQLVQTIDYELSSLSIPNLLLMDIKGRFALRADTMRGLPVEYVERHEPEIIERLLTELRADPVVQRHHLKPLVHLVPGTNLGVHIMLESDEYKIWFEGYADTGNKDNNVSGRAHFGKYFSAKDELFTEIGLKLDDVEWNFAVGYAYHHGKTTASLMRSSPDGGNVYRLEQAVTPKWRLRSEYFSDSNTFEFGVRYRIHEFLSAEYVYSNDKPYFRLIGNL